MVSLKILFADDQIPKDKPDDEISNEERKLKDLVDELEHSHYKVKIANTFKDAIDKANNCQFDIAIIDMGWYYDKENIPKSINFLSAGWQIFDAIKNV